jgi:hypothetical protein
VLVRRIDERVDQADRNTLDLFAPQHRHQRANRADIQRQQHVALVVQPFGNRKAQVARHQWLRQRDVEIVLVVSKRFCVSFNVDSATPRPAS